MSKWSKVIPKVFEKEEQNVFDSKYKFYMQVISWARNTGKDKSKEKVLKALLELKPMQKSIRHILIPAFVEVM